MTLRRTRYLRQRGLMRSAQLEFTDLLAEKPALSSKRVSAFLRKPVLHFFLLGALLYGFSIATAPPEAPPSVAYPSQERIALLKREWLTATGSVPDEATLQRLIQLELDQSMLFNEALRLKLHLRDSVVQQRLLRDMRFLGDSEGKSDAELLQQAYAMNMHANDLVVRRRLVQAMESIYRAPGEAEEPHRDDLVKIYREKQQEFTLPASLEMSHVYVSVDKHGEQTKSLAKRMQQVFAADKVVPEQALQSSDPFLSGNRFPYLPPRQLEKHFGERFTRQVFACPTKTWCGPLTSPYGEHIVWVHGKKPAQLQSFDAVRDKLVYHFRRQRGDEAQAEQMEALRARYAVVKP